MTCRILKLARHDLDGALGAEAASDASRCDYQKVPHHLGRSLSSRFATLVGELSAVALSIWDDEQVVAVTLPDVPGCTEGVIKEPRLRSSWCCLDGAAGGRSDRLN